MESSPLDEATLASVRELIWGSLSGDDVQRWYRQELEFNDPIAVPNCRFGLKQRSGGPCGVLAALQGYLIARLAFKNLDLCSVRTLIESGSSEAPKKGSEDDVFQPSEEALRGAISHALAFVAWQAGDMARAKVVLCEESALPISSETPASAFTVFSFDSFEETEGFICSILPQFSTASGVALLMFSVILSRGIDAIKADCDEPGALVARFGHCSQELLNLFLTGQATSGIFDGTQTLTGEPVPASASGAVGSAGGGSGSAAMEEDTLVLKGITRRPLIGYLSHAEAMRYLKIGEFFKSPLLPIWCVGSESHFSTLFSVDTAAIDESPSADLFRAFKKFDQHDNQFIPRDKLAEVLKELSLPLTPPASAADLEKSLEEAAKKIDTASTGFILWTDFFLFASQLRAGKTVDEAAALVASGDDSIVDLTGDDSSSGSGGGAGSSSSSSSSAVLSYDDLVNYLQAAFMQADTEDVQFLPLGKIGDVIATATKNLPSRYRFKKDGEDVRRLVSELAAGQDHSEVIVLWDDLLRCCEPVLRKLATDSAQDALKQEADKKEADKMPQAPWMEVLSGGKKIEIANISDPSALFGAGAGAAAGGASSSAAPLSPPGGPLFVDTALAASMPKGDESKGKTSSSSSSSNRRFVLFHYNGLTDGGRKPQCVRIAVEQRNSGLAPVSAHEDALAIQALTSMGSSSSSSSASSSIVGLNTSGGASSTTVAGGGGGAGEDDDDLQKALALSMMDVDAASASSAAAVAAPAPSSSSAMEASSSSSSSSSAGGGAGGDSDLELALALSRQEEADAARKRTETGGGGAAAGAGAVAAPAPPSPATSAASSAASSAAVGTAPVTVTVTDIGPLAGIIRTKWPGAAVTGDAKANID